MGKRRPAEATFFSQRAQGYSRRAEKAARFLRFRFPFDVFLLSLKNGTVAPRWLSLSSLGLLHLLWCRASLSLFISSSRSARRAPLLPQLKMFHPPPNSEKGPSRSEASSVPPASSSSFSDDDDPPAEEEEEESPSPPRLPLSSSSAKKDCRCTRLSVMRECTRLPMPPEG